MNDAYVDGHACAFRDTMICYRDDAEKVRVPARVARLKLKRLGMGALCCPNAVEVALEEGYESVFAETIGRLGVWDKKSFQVSLRLPESFERVEALLPNTAIKIAGKALLRRVALARRMSLRDYRTISENAVPVNGGLRLPVCVTEERSFCRPLVEVLRAGGIGVIEPSGLEFPLFRFDEHDSRPMLFKPKACFARDAERSAMTENEALLRRIERGQWGARSVEAERWNDRMQQTGCSILDRKQAVALIGYDERSVVRSGGIVRLVLEACISDLFAQSLRRVRLGGKDYFVYARQYPQSAGGVPAYLREDVCVYGGDRMVTDPALSEEVYEKYRLLNML